MYGVSSVVVLIVFMVGRVACSIYKCNCVTAVELVVYVPSIIVLWKSSFSVIWGFAKKEYTPLFLRQKGAHLKNVWTIYNKHSMISHCSPFWRKNTGEYLPVVKKKGPVAFSLATLRNMICVVLGCCGTEQDFYRRLGPGTVRNLLVSVGF